MDRDKFLKYSILTAWFFMLLALTVAYSFAYTLELSLASRNWPATNGTVVLSTSRFSNKGGKYAIVKYRYFIDGFLHENGRISAKLSSDRWDEILRKYPEGKNIDVYYDPAAPSRSLLEPGFSWGKARIGMIAMSIVELVLTGLSVLALWLRKQVKLARFNGALFVVFPKSTEKLGPVPETF